MVQAAMAVSQQQRNSQKQRAASLSSSTGSQDDALRISRNLIIPYQAETSSRDLATCEGVFRMLDAWQQQDDARLATLQRKHLKHLI